MVTNFHNYFSILSVIPVKMRSSCDVRSRWSWNVDHMVVIGSVLMVLVVLDASCYTTSAFQIERMRIQPINQRLPQTYELNQQQQQQNIQRGVLFSSRSDDATFIDRVKKSGGGVPAGMPPGHNSVFDPSKEGKIGGTYDRIRNGSLLETNTVDLLSSISIDHIKKVGGGIPLSMPGNNCVFDPSVEGKLFGPTLNDRTKYGASYQFAATTAAHTTTKVPLGTILLDTQHWLEDIGIPQNFAKPTAPVSATVLGRARIISEDSVGDIEHIVLRLPKGFHYLEGQSISIIPPGNDPNTNKPYKPRLYSIASTRYGDLLDGNTVSLCIRSAQYYDPVTGLRDPEKDGICSNYLCNLNKGDSVTVAGPVGKTMLLPTDDHTKDIIMVATGTGIAPFRGFLHRLFMENTIARHMYTGKAWLVLGVPTSGGLLYQEELDVMKQNSISNGKNNLEVSYAISREMKNNDGGKLYVQDVLTNRADELLERLDNGAIIYFCGLKGMMPGILEALEKMAQSKNIDWTAKMSELQKNHQWHVEVY